MLIWVFYLKASFDWERLYAWGNKVDRIEVRRIGRSAIVGWGYVILSMGIR